MAESTRNSARKEWIRPELNKLPITATGGQPKGAGNEGGGAGKGDAGAPGTPS